MEETFKLFESRQLSAPGRDMAALLGAETWPMRWLSQGVETRCCVSEVLCSLFLKLFIFLEV